MHRDIKPSNLIVDGLDLSRFERDRPGAGPPAACVKILDLGLARLHRPIDEVTAGLTGANAVLMGTLDYMAPEQRWTFTTWTSGPTFIVWGCTLYFLLTGQPPFPGGTVAQKVLRQQQAEPTPLGQFRTDLPAGLPPVVHKMMAKQREEALPVSRVKWFRLWWAARTAGGIAGSAGGRRAVGYARFWWLASALRMGPWCMVPAVCPQGVITASQGRQSALALVLQRLVLGLLRLPGKLPLKRRWR